MTGKIVNWMKQHSTELIMTAVFALFPLLCAILWCLKDGHFIWDVYLPASYWNDELMYYKQVEALVEHGMPVGYFGYNEAHGQILYFATWNPLILLPWLLWGLVFGWGLVSPVYANIFYTMLCMGGFYLLARPGKRQSAWIFGLLAVFTPFTRYLLSGMPESMFLAFTILFMGCAAAWLRKKTWGLLVAMFVIAIFFTMVRPYLIMFLLLPIFFCIWKYRLKGVVVSAAVILLAAAGYIISTLYWTAPYMEQSIDTGWLALFKTDGAGAGFGYIFQTLYEKFYILFTDYLKRAVKYGLFSGALYATTGFVTVLSAIWLGLLYAKKERSDLRWLYWHYCISVTGMILALFLFYKMGEGSKHLMSFIVLGLLLLGLTAKRTLVMKLSVMAVCGYFFIVKVFAPYDWQVPYDDGIIKSEAESLEAQVDAGLTLKKDSEDPYENTIIWLAWDVVEGESISAAWGLLYMMPDGFGINFCTQDYVTNHFEELRSVYIALLPGGEVEQMVLEHDYQKVAETERMAVYERENR